MIFTCDKSVLCEQALKVSRAVSNKSPMAALTGILIIAKNGNLTLTGYDLEMAMKTNVEADIKQEGKIILDAKLFTDILRKLPEGTVKVEVNERNFCTISLSKSVFNLVGINADEYPGLPTVENGKEISLDKDLFASMIRQTIFCHAEPSISPKAIYTGLFCAIENGEIMMAAIDGYRIAIRKEKLESDIRLAFICPAKAMAEILKMCESEDGDIHIYSSTRHIIFEINNITVISRLIDGEFLDFEKLIPTEEEIILRTQYNCADMIETFDRISPMVTDPRKTPIRCIIKDGIFKAICNTEIGTAQDEFEIEMNGDNLEIGFRSNYILDAVRAADCDKVKMNFKGATGQAVIKPIEGEEFIFIILPIRLK
ncbi:MAG: DNA polymerase III subunit beta [Acutalibacteraceae bacterium]|nr:DNA polymerase III subunit beta [Acutalibacteraceae bacterium]